MDIKSHVEALNTERLKLANELKNHLADYVEKNPGKPMDAEAQATADRIEADIDRYDAEVKRFVDRETREQDHAKVRLANESLFGEKAVEQAEQTERQRFAAWARGAGPKEYDVNLSQAVEISNMVRDGASPADIRNVVLTTSGSGSLLVPTDLATTIYEYMTASVAMMRMPTTKLSTTGGNPLALPKVGTHGIGTQVLEGVTIGGTDPVFAQTTLNAYKYGQMVSLSSETIADDGVDIVGFVGRNIARAVGEVVATALVSGSGSDAPEGVDTFVTNAAVSGGTVHSTIANATNENAYGNAIDLVYRVNDSYRSKGTNGFLVRDLTAAAWRKLRDGAGGTVGAVLWQPSLTNGLQGGQPDTFLGYPVWTDPNVASIASTHKIAFFGDWESYYIRLAGGFRFERSDDYLFGDDEVAFRGLTRVDGHALDGRAINAWRVV